MLDEYGFEIYEENAFPVAYLLTFRTFGTWLHGDSRGSMGKNENNHYGEATIAPNRPLREKMQEQMQAAPVFLDETQRLSVAEAITEVCSVRFYDLLALNVRTNHVHCVVSKAIKPEKIVNDLKAYSTRKLRRVWQVGGNGKVWSRGASTRYLWKPRHVVAAVDYVLYCQEDVPFEFGD